MCLSLVFKVLGSIFLACDAREKRCSHRSCLSLDEFCMYGALFGERFQDVGLGGMLPIERD